jgi:site-specific DNA-methyltransferase (adenine-specific)
MITFHDKLPNPVQKVGEPQIVKTPVDLAERILDGYPASVWKEKDWKWLNPVSKSGVFELGLYKRLMVGLADIIPNKDERREWIVREMIWSFCPTVACELFVRRNYLGKIYNDIGGWVGLRGNVQKRDFLKARLGKGGTVMAKKNERGEEKYVKFDCIVGNPPYQRNSGDTSDIAFYPAFVEKAISLQPKYLSMVIPAKWMMGDGKGTDEFLEAMTKCKKLSRIVATKNSREWFPDIDLKGGAMYFLYDAKKDDTKTSINGVEYDLADTDIIITDLIALGIKCKVLAKCNTFFDTKMYGQNPYGINTNHKDWTTDKDNSYVCHCSGGSGKGEITRLVTKKLIIKNTDTINKWKLCIAKNSGKGGDGTGHSFVIRPNSIMTQSYLMFGCFDSENEANNAHSFLYTHFAQFMSSVLKGTQNVSKRVFKWLPYLDFSRSYTDQDLYAMFNLSAEEIAHIENTTKDFPIFRDKKKRKTNKEDVVEKFREMASEIR